ncbi:MAG: DUF2811 domain-containing protein [Candidatus Thioglobus sp.]|nr:MAG: DUF2811 domain-containing protein [Candidatus Thioglobus sp.]
MARTTLKTFISNCPPDLNRVLRRAMNLFLFRNGCRRANQLTIGARC